MSLLRHIPGLFGRFKRTVLLVAATGVLIWVAFFDSHSLISRVQLIREEARLEAENQEMRDEIARLEEMLDRELTDEEIERIAREQYGMSRPDETVYPVIPQE